MKGEVTAKAELITRTVNCEDIITAAYLQCRHSALDAGKVWDDKTYTQRIESIMKSGHFSILEHASATIQIIGVSRSLTHQLVRHRIASYAQLSQRAVPIDKVGYIVPPSVQADKDASEIFRAFMVDVEYTYKGLEARGIPLEDARFVLPNATETQIVVTMNFRAWLHFLKLRLDEHAQWEIRGLAEQIWKILQGVDQEVFSKKYTTYWE